jgi:DNA-binding MarR family transcriptional regulator
MINWTYRPNQAQVVGFPPIAAVPPPAIEETGWDILLAVHSDVRCELSLAKLASLVSIPQPSLNQWLSLLEERGLIAAAKHRFTDELRATLTPAGRKQLDRYLEASAELQAVSHH